MSMWFFAFIVSFLINIFLFFYIRWLLLSISDLNEENNSINNQILSFLEHVKSIHELEMFYGDETLQSLMSHGKQLSESLSQLDFITDQEDEEEPLSQVDEALP